MGRPVSGGPRGISRGSFVAATEFLIAYPLDEGPPSKELRLGGCRHARLRNHESRTAAHAIWSQSPTSRQPMPCDAPLFAAVALLVLQDRDPSRETVVLVVVLHATAGPQRVHRRGRGCQTDTWATRPFAPDPATLAEARAGFAPARTTTTSAKELAWRSDSPPPRTDRSQRPGRWTARPPSSGSSGPASGDLGRDGPAQDKAASEMLGWVTQHATTRVGPHGRQLQVLAAHGFTFDPETTDGRDLVERWNAELRDLDYQDRSAISRGVPTARRRRRRDVDRRAHQSSRLLDRRGDHRVGRATS